MVLQGVDVLLGFNYVGDCGLFLGCNLGELGLKGMDFGGECLCGFLEFMGILG